jgi:hypothetical protein
MKLLDDPLLPVIRTAKCQLYTISSD